MDDKEKQLYVLLAIFGAMAGIGPYIVFEASSAWGLLAGCALTVFGFGGLLMLLPSRPRIQQRIVGIVGNWITRVPLNLMGVVGVWMLVALLVYTLHDLRSDLNEYAMPRSVTQKQYSDLREYLSKRVPANFPIMVMAEPTDPEAVSYAAQLGDALTRAGWEATCCRTPNHPLHDGVLIGSSGIVPKNNPYVILDQALSSINVGSGYINIGPFDKNEYQLYLLVGHRPVAIGYTVRRSLLFRVGDWLRNKAIE
jgi:hypothetical protein